MRTRAIIVLVLAALAGWAPYALAQCAMCGNSFGQNDPTVTAFNTSVLFLMAAPYSIFFAGAACVVLLYRRAMAGRRATIIPLSRRRTDAPADGPKEVTP
ncbi:MAG TPA: hypothetical protein VMS22_07535 [Candidatus Eisenbacteria bacterium]|nr:hypothetical protein [Candidatus Eisenbacteria bacterium]